MSFYFSLAQDKSEVLEFFSPSSQTIILGWVWVWVGGWLLFLTLYTHTHVKVHLCVHKQMHEYNKRMQMHYK